MRLRALAPAATLAAAALGLTAAAPGAPQLRFPVACEIGRTCEVQRYVDRDPGPGALDYRCQRRTADKHSGVDIRILNLAAQQRGVDVLAAAPGKVLRVRDGMPDQVVTTQAQLDRLNATNTNCGNAAVIDHGGGWSTQYCHMARGSVRVKPGDTVQGGQPIGRVGYSGEASFPHLHLTVRRNTEVVDPFAPDPVRPGACAPQAGMWTPEAKAKMPYKAGTLLDFGFSGAGVTKEQIEAGQIAPAGAAAPVLAVYAYVIQVDRGDQLELVLTGPGGGVLAQHKLAPFDRDKPQYFQMIGKKRPATGWPKGGYGGVVRLWRAGKPVIERKIEMRL